MKTYIACENGTRTLVIPERAPVGGEWCQVTDSNRPKYVKYFQFHTPIIPVLLDAQEARFTFIKQEAATRIIATDWQLQRVEERNRRGKKSQTDVDVVLDMRDKIRTDSDLAEIEVMALTTIEEVKAFTW